jgi:hypothetical protein
MKFSSKFTIIKFPKENKFNRELMKHHCKQTNPNANKVSKRKISSHKVLSTLYLIFIIGVFGLFLYHNQRICIKFHLCQDVWDVAQGFPRTMVNYVNEGTIFINLENRIKLFIGDFVCQQFKAFQFINN